MINIVYMGNLNDAYHVALSYQDMILLVVKIKECESYTTLCEKLPIIAENVKLNKIIVADLSVEKDSEVSAMANLRLTDVPAIYYFFNGRILGGWFGYDYNMPPEIRINSLSLKINYKYPVRV